MMGNSMWILTSSAKWPWSCMLRLECIFCGHERRSVQCLYIFFLRGIIDLVTCSKYSTKGFTEWCWRILLALKLHMFEQPFLAGDREKVTKINRLSTISGFASLPSVDTDTNLLPIAKGLQSENPFAIYITLTMTERGHRPDLLDQNLELLILFIEVRTSSSH